MRAHPPGPAGVLAAFSPRQDYLAIATADGRLKTFDTGERERERDEEAERAAAAAAPATAAASGGRCVCLPIAWAVELGNMPHSHQSLCMQHA